uniref:Vitellogenin domain-containing protein n=1 Tax=Scophthalmus maximus TaxID=52904 RepID=A0A8D3E8C5_SCOMX
MGYTKLCLLLLLSSYTFAQEGSDVNEQTSACLLASRFKAHKKYVYQYTTESRNGVVGTANLRNGPKVSCQVEIEVPQACRFIMHTRDCVLGEVSAMDPQGQPVYRQSPGSQAFKAAIEKNPLKFTVEDATSVQLYPETDEPVNILNIKRGIVSALVAPVMEEGQSSFMSTVHGLCLTDNLVNSRKDIPTDVTLSRDLSQCDQFYSRGRTNSPLALLQKLHNPISSTQDCDYQFDNKGKHIMTAMCTEKHIYLPFSNEDNGLSSVVTQDLRLQSSKRISNRVFGDKPLHFEDPDDKDDVQTKDAVLSTLRDLAALAGTNQGQKRPSLFHKLVSSLRVLRNETLSQTVTDMLDVSGWLTWQALLQCGTPECTSAIFQAIRAIDGVSLEVDALVYALSLQANPDAARVRDMLSMAQYKQKHLMIPSMSLDVSKFMETLLNDFSSCQGNLALIFIPLHLQVVGVMGEAMQAVSPSLISTVLQCAKKTESPLSNQKAAIQAFRLMDINDEVRNVLVEVYQDTQSSTEKRIASYLILMKSPHDGLVKDILNNLENVRDEQLKSFVVSHLNNIRNSDEPQIFREYIALALTDHPSTRNKTFDGMSRNYKVDSPLGSARTNIIFDGRDTLPKELMLETTLKVFDYNYDIFEVGVEGSGFEPTIDALFGEEGFFPDSISRIVYWAGDKAQVLRDVLKRFTPDRDRMKRQVPQNLLKDITNNIQKLMNDVRFSQAPEAIAYLRLLGNEIGYLKPSEISGTLSMYYQVFTVLLPTKFLLSLVSSTNNKVFAHYIFMENAFSLPTASGFPLKFSLAGVFTPGARGGLSFPKGMTDFSFMPSVGLEFITQMGVHIPDYLDAGLEMHSNIYHESSINAEVTVNSNQMRLSIPAPKSNIELLSISNKLLSVSSGQTTIVPSLMEDRTDSTECQPLFSGMKFCTILRYSNATSMDKAPYYPLTGETRFAIEIQPTGEISEYTATITSETLRDGKKGRHKVETLKLTLKAEGDDSTEATATMKYDRSKNILTTEVLIPDYDVEAGVKLAVTDRDAKGQKMRGITIDVTNRNIPQLTLMGRTRVDMMKDAMLQLQMVIPSLKTDASFTATLKTDEVVLMDLETIITLPETSYQQKALLKYDADKFEVELKSDLNSEIHKLIQDEDYHEQLQQLIDDILDQKVAKTDMKLRHIVTKGIEAGNIWLDKLTARIPYLANLRSKRSLSDLSFDSLFRYQFNKDKMAISLSLPLGGKKSEELKIPSTLSIPLIDLRAIGLYIPAKTYPLPSFIIPASLDFTVPLLGLAEASTKINSNFYLWEGSISGGNSTVDVPSYIAQYKAMAQSPLNLLSYKLEGKTDDNLKYLLNTSFSHSLIDTSFSVLETIRVTNKLNAKASYKIEASSPLGLQARIYYSAQSTSTLDSGEVSGDGTLDALLKIDSFYTNTSYTHSYNLLPIHREGRGESTLHFDSPFIQIHNRIHGVYANSELNVVSKTNAQNDLVKHVAELKYKDAQLILKCNAIATVMDKSLNNKIELGVSSHMAILRIESQADDDTNRAYSLISGSLDLNGLEVNSEGSLTFDTGRGLHKASVMVGRNGLTTSGTNSIQCIPVTVENIFNGALDNNGASLSSRTKAMAEESRGELNIEGKVTGIEASLYGVLKGHTHDVTTRNSMDIVLNHRALTFSSNTMGTLKQMTSENSHTLTLTLWTLALSSKTNNKICEDIYYKQDTKFDMKPFVVSFDMTNDLNFYDVNLKNEGHMKLEPIKVDLSGSMMGAYGDEHNIKHTYELTYEDMAGTMKYSMSGDVMDAQLSHNCELEFAGLSSKSTCETRINSEPLRFDSTIRTMALPFTVTIDALVNSDGELNLYAKHTGQLYSKLLMKAEPLALAYSLDSRMSTTHFLPDGESSSNLDNKIDGLLAPNDQYLTWKVKSKLNNHAYNQDISTFNSPEKIGFEFSGAILTDVFSKLSKDNQSQPEIQEFTTAGFLKYDKNSDCHIIYIPFIESVPAGFEQLKNTLAQLDSKYRIVEQIKDMLFEIRQIIENFDINMIFQDVIDYLLSIDLASYVEQLSYKIPSSEIAKVIESMNDVIVNWIDEYEIPNKLNAVYSYIRDLLLKYNLDEKLKKLMDQIVILIKEFRVEETVQSVVDALKSIKFEFVHDRIIQFLEKVTNQLRATDFKKSIDDLNEHMSSMLKSMKEFEYSAFVDETNIKIADDICIPIFGKLHGEFTVNSPLYTLVTTGKFENSTSTTKNPQFTATIVSQVKSPIEPLEYTFEATADLGAPRMKKLLFTEAVKATHMAFSIDHKGSLTLTGSSAEASAKTTSKATTHMYKADLVNNMALTLKSGISAAIDTTYNHNLDIPSIETSSQASMKHNMAATMESGRITVTGETSGNGKWSVKDYSDEGTHTSNVDFNINFSTARLTFVGETDFKALKSKQTLSAESVILSHITVEAQCETEVPFVKKSLMVLNGQTHIGDLKVALTASHDAEFTGSLTGSMSNSLEFLAHPFEIVLDVKHKVNSRIFLPLKLTGKVDLLHDYGVILNSEKQRACWFALTRFNQYKFNHNFTAENNEEDIFFHSSATGEANLDFLTVPLSIPEIEVPYIEMKTPEVRHFSLWEQAGFKTLLTTPHQSFDMSLKLHYYKNPDFHSIELHLEPIYTAISDNTNIIQVQFEQWRDKEVALLKDSYYRAKLQYIKHKIDTSSLPPRIFTVPGYKIPILNIDVSAFIPALGFSVPSYTLVLPSLELPVIHVPESLSEIKLPTLTLPAIQNNIVIPAMGNITCDLSFKSTVVTLSANAGLYNQSDIVARFGASLTSVFDPLNGKIDGTTSLTRKSGMKLASTVSIQHNNIEANHECAVSLTKRSMEASVANTAKINLPFLNLEVNQELIGNTNINFRFACRKDGITTSMSSPSSGFLGLHFQHRSPSQLYGKLFSRYLSTPEKDTDVFTAKAMLKNSQKLLLQMSWNLDFLHDVIEGTKDRIPAMNNAMLKFINKYHTAHFGFDLNRGSMKLKTKVSNVIDRAYDEVPMSLSTLQSSIQNLGNQGKDMYREASDSLMLINMHDVKDRFAHAAQQVLKHSENQIIFLLDALTQFLSDTNFTVPGSEEKLSSLEMFYQARRTISKATDRAIQRFTRLVREVSRYIREIEFTIPGTQVVVNGKEIMDQLFSFLHKTVNNSFQVIIEKAEIFLTYLKNENNEIASQVDVAYAEVLQSSKGHIDEAKRHMAGYKDLTKRKIHEAYNALNMEFSNNNTKEFISILQSHLYGGLNEGVDLMRRASQSTAPYIRVTNKKTDIEIPLPFLWKSFSEFPKQYSQ